MEGLLSSADQCFTDKKEIAGQRVKYKGKGQQLYGLNIAKGL